MTERPPLTVVVVSYPSTLERHFEETAQLYARLAGPALVLERCQDPVELPALVARWHNRGRVIRTLDLVGHGDGGRFKLGDELLFTSDGVGYELAAEVAQSLSREAHVRLLGCNIALPRHPRDPVRTSGAKLMRDLARVFGARRRVAATTGYLGPEHFDVAGLNQRGEQLLVWSQSQSHVEEDNTWRSRKGRRASRSRAR